MAAVPDAFTAPTPGCSIRTSITTAVITVGAPHRPTNSCSTRYRKRSAAHPTSPSCYLWSPKILITPGTMSPGWSTIGAASMMGNPSLPSKKKKNPPISAEPTTCRPSTIQLRFLSDFIIRSARSRRSFHPHRRSPARLDYQPRDRLRHARAHHQPGPPAPASL